MIVIIPIGGIGKRFKDNGYRKPKALINLYGKPIISYLLDNLNLTNVDYIYIPYNKEYVQYRFEDFLRKSYPEIVFKFYVIENNTRGAAETIDIALDNLDEKRNIPILCLDSDNWYKTDVITQWNGDNCVFSFEDFNSKPIYSYLKLNNNNEIIDIKEKDKISNNASTGAYGFASIKTLKTYTSKIIRENITQKSEFYTSVVIYEMLKDKHIFKNKKIEIKDYVCLGTPLQLKIFNNNNNDSITNKRICFDFDNTLVTFPTIANDYSSVKPIEQNINFLKHLKHLGNTIIIYTARRMKTHNGNIGKINADIGKLTFNTLEKFDIPYDEIYFGKPNADFYIDDLALSCFDDLEREMGYYNTKIEPRDFHTIETNYTQTITKKGDLKGEYFYYNNIPNGLKELFPVYISGNEQSITIQKIAGATLTDIYLSELLTKDNFINVLNSICRIHQISSSDDVNIYDNYANKLEKRYANYDYSFYENSKKIYTELLEKLKNYEKSNCGKKTIIHGDTVFTNIIVNNHGEIKFIDMRGKLGNNLTMCGDWLYDWSKIYQSLIGYDEILLSKNINLEYKDKMINIFKNFFINKFSQKDFENLKIITKSFLFTLIPLHNNEKCIDYYNLMYSKYLM
tara:strand:- start:1289 stop:3166 length:1878 start_codon:yes stop_codon:yes gene_type:complete